MQAPGASDSVLEVLLDALTSSTEQNSLAPTVGKDPKATKMNRRTSSVTADDQSEIPVVISNNTSVSMMTTTADGRDKSTQPAVSVDAPSEKPTVQRKGPMSRESICTNAVQSPKSMSRTPVECSMSRIGDERRSRLTNRTPSHVTSRSNVSGEKAPEPPKMSTMKPPPSGTTTLPDGKTMSDGKTISDGKTAETALTPAKRPIPPTDDTSPETKRSKQHEVESQPAMSSTTSQSVPKVITLVELMEKRKRLETIHRKREKLAAKQAIADKELELYQSHLTGESAKLDAELMNSEAAYASEQHYYDFSEMTLKQAHGPDGQ